MASKENDKKQSSGLRNFVKSLLAVSPGAQAALVGLGIGQEVKKKKKKPKVETKSRPTKITGEESRKAGDPTARKSFHDFIKSELKTQSKAAQEAAKKAEEARKRNK